MFEIVYLFTMLDEMVEKHPELTDEEYVEIWKAFCKKDKDSEKKELGELMNKIKSLMNSKESVDMSTKDVH